MTSKLLLRAILCLALCLPAAATTTVTANLKSALGTAYQSDAFVRFRLRGYSGSVPRVSGGIIVVTIPDVAPDASGLVTTSLYNNYEITPAGTYWTVEYWAGGNMVSTANYTICTITSGACSSGISSFDLDSATANTIPPVVLAPTGDSTYIRKDGGNIPASAAANRILRGYVTPQDFGAVADGVTDDTVAIQAAHDAAVIASFLPVYFPAGTYKVSSGLGWSPYIQAISLGRVTLTTALASGNFITISDLYGGSSITLNGLTRSKTFSGQFYLENTNASNTAISLFIGGATNANYATQMEINGMSITGFKGGVIRLGYNSILLHFANLFAYNNQTGAQISVAPGVTNTGENIYFDHSVFGGLGNTPSGVLMSIDTVLPMDFSFTQCSFDYLEGINDATKTAPLTNVSMVNSHFEWDQVTAPFINLDNGITYNLVNPYVTSPLVAGWFNPFVGKVTGASVLKVTNAHYTLAPSIPKLYAGALSTSRIDLDPHPNYEGGSAPTTYVSYGADNNPRVSMLDSGFIGIAKAVPTQALDVMGSVAVSVDVITDSVKSKSTDLTIDSAAVGRSLILSNNGTEMARVSSGGLVIGSGTPIAKYVEGTVTQDVGSISANTCTDTNTITVTGAVDGDTATVGVLAAVAATAGLQFSAYVSAANTAKVRICNVTTGAIDPASTTYRAGVIVH